MGCGIFWNPIITTPLFSSSVGVFSPFLELPLRVFEREASKWELSLLLVRLLLLLTFSGVVMTCLWWSSSSSSFSKASPTRVSTL